MPQLSQPPSGSASLEDNDALLTYRVGPVYCCGPTLPIVTIIPPPTLTRPPGTSIAEPGIFKHGQYVVSATDLRYRFGVKRENWKQPGQVIIAQHDEITRGYFVDEIIDVIRFPQTGWGALPACLPRGVFSRTLLINNKIFLYAEFDKLSTLQGTDYLAEYIAQLETLDNSKSEQVPDTPAASQDVSTLPSSNKMAGMKSLVSTNQSEPEPEPKPEPTSVHLIKVTDNTIRAGTESTKTKPDNTNTEKSKQKTSGLNNFSEKKPLSNSSSQAPHTTDKPLTEPIQKPVTQKASATKINKNENHTPSKASLSASSKKIQHTDTARSHTIENNTRKKPLNIQQAQQENIQKIEPAHNNPAGFNPGLLLFAVLLLLAGGIYYYSEVTHREPTTHGNERFFSTYTAESSPTIPESPVENNQQPVNTTVPDDNNQMPPDPDPIRTKTELATIETNQAIDTTSQKPAQEYRATINQQDDTITIELDGPQPPAIKSDSELSQPEASNPEPPASTTKASSIPATIKKKSATAKTKTNMTPTEPTNTNNHAVEIIHIIVKGDTLWAIAKHYLQNPFLYPELAKLSKIKNPDLIYPGNHVRIIYRGKQLKQ